MSKHDPLSANALPAAAFHRLGRKGEDPLAHFMANIVQRVAGTVVFNASHVTASLLLAQHVSFDPNATVEGESMLSFVINRTPPFPVRRLERAWPSSLAGFGPHLLEQYEQHGKAGVDEVDNEWLAAVLLAAGADPWEGRGDASAPYPVGVRLGRPLFYALTQRMAGLVDVLMSKPGAPDFSFVAACPVEKAIGGASALSWLHACAADPKGAPLVARFLAGGADPHREVDGEHPLQKACLPVLEVYAQYAVLPSDPGLRRALEGHWRQRMKARELTPDDFAGMVAILKGQLPQERAAVALEAVLTREVSGLAWGDTNRALSNHEGYNLSHDYLLSRSTLKKGTWAGQWTGWAAKMMRGLRGSDVYGVSIWDFPRMLGADFTQPQRAGELKTAMGFDWRPGIAIDGVVMLALLGQKRPVSAAMAARDRWENVQALGSILGIDDMRQWSAENVEAAVAFTEHLPANSSGTAFRVLRTAWKQVLALQPEILKDRDDLQLRLVQALHGNYHAPFQYSDVAKQRTTEGVLGEIFQALPSYPQIKSAFTLVEPFDLEKMSASARSLALEAGLLLETNAWLLEIQRSAQAGELGEAELARIKVWVGVREKQMKTKDPNLKLDETQIIQMRALMLSQAWSAKLPTTPPRPRM